MAELAQADYMTDDVKYKGEKHEGPDYLAPYPVSRFSPSVDLVAIAAEIARADDSLALQATAKLRVLAEQIEKLQEKAREIIDETRRNQELHRAECSFRKVAGQKYYLYRNAEGVLAFSLIGPDEWGRRHGGQPPAGLLESTG